MKHTVPTLLGVVGSSNNSQWGTKVSQQIDMLLASEVTPDGRLKVDSTTSQLRIADEHDTSTASSTRRKIILSAEQRYSRPEYRRVRAYQNELDIETELDPRRHTPLEEGHAIEEGHAASAPAKQETLVFSRIAIPRFLAAALLCHHREFDALGTPAGATFRSVSDLKFCGNSSFFTWLLGRLRLDYRIDRKTADLKFNLEHGRAALSLSGELCLLRILQYVPNQRKPRKVHTNILTTDQADEKIDLNLTPFENKPGRKLILDVYSTTSSSCGTLMVTRHMICAAMPLRGDRCVQRAAWLLYLNSDADLADWLLRHASVVLKRQGSIVSFTSRRCFVAVITMFLPNRQSTARLLKMEMPGGVRHHEEWETKYSGFPTQTTRALRLASGRKGLALYRRGKAPVYAHITTSEWALMTSTDKTK